MFFEINEQTFLTDIISLSLITLSPGKASVLPVPVLFETGLVDASRLGTVVNTTIATFWLDSVGKMKIADLPDTATDSR